MLRFKTPHLFLLLGLIAPACASAHYCVRVNGGFGNGGQSFVGKGFTVPAPGVCARWSGFVKFASSVIAVSTGTGCRSTNGKVLTVTVFSSNPSFFGAGQFSQDHIELCPAGVTDCPIGAGRNSGSFFSGPAAPQTCTTALLTLPAIHD